MKTRTKRILVLIGAAVIATAGIVMCAPSTTHALFGWDRINKMIERASDAPVGGDLDGDGVLDENDNCIEVANPDQSNIDCDDYGDVCDSDIDNDGVENDADACDSDPDDAITDIEVGEDGCPIAPDDPTGVSEAFPAGGPGDGTGPGGMNPFGPGGPLIGADMTAESECALMETAAFNPALFILLGAALLPIVRSRRK